MDLTFLLDQWVRAEKDIAKDAEQLLQQQAIIEELERKGQDATYARSVFRQLKEMQTVRIVDRNRIRSVLRNSGQALEEDSAADDDPEFKGSSSAHRTVRNHLRR